MATSVRPYKNDQRKNIESQNMFVQPKTMIKSSEIKGERKERLKRWIHFFRKNPNYLIRDYFGITLHPFQIMMIWVLQKSTLAYIVAARAASKTFIIAIWALTLSILYPGIKICTVSKTLKQGSLIIGKIDELRHKYSNVWREIDTCTINPNGAEVKFHCGSNIKAVPSSESARGNRANYIIIEESRLVPKEILEQVIKPFLEVRMPNYMTLKEYKDIKELREDGTISFITSAWYTAEYWYSYVKTCIKRMVAGDETSNFLAFDHKIVLRHGIKTEKMLKDEMDDTDDLTIQMEYYNIPSGSSGHSYFPLRLFPRNLKKAFYPQPEMEYNSKKNKYDIPKEEGEIRFVTVDVATRENKANDNSIIACVRLIPLVGRGYERHLCYMESHKGQHVGVQAKRIKEIFYDFQADFICLDIQTSGIGVFDSLSENTIDDERDITYPPLTVVSEEYTMVKDLVREDLRNNHTRGLNALPIIFPISASEELNSQIATALKISLQKKLWKFLIAEGDAEDYLIKSVPEFTKDAGDSDTYARFLNPYVNVGLFVSECINLDLKPVGDKIKLIEKSGCYKDRYSAVSYCNFVISTEFDKWLLKEQNNKNDDWEILSGLFQMY
jgi:hypothetical protein